jgi:peptidoglycan/LPS O-acetylase OafA/YrhL
MEFRKDINGLRAVAVAAVVLYHYGVPPFTGGFVGVDIFFVISGFLLTSIAWRDLQVGAFSWWQFLLKRVRRIFPALAAMTAGCILWAGCFYLPGDYKHFVRVATSVLIFKSNYSFVGDVGYFAPDARQNLLLHTWSLSLESQFYVAFAACCGLFWPRASGSGRRLGAMMFITIVLASLVWCLWRTGTDQMAAFYLLASRAWEFMAGSVAAVYFSGQRGVSTNRLMSAFGAILLAVGICFLKSTDPYPGWRALLPVCGAVMLILSEGGLFSRILASSPFQFLGRTSYSVYLWHWPLLLAFRERTGREPSTAATLVLIASSLIAGWVSYRIVEKPTRRKFRDVPLLVGTVGTIAAGFALSALLWFTDGLPQRLPDYLRPAAMATTSAHSDADSCMRAVDGSQRTPHRGDFCHIGYTSAPTTLMLWGDSFADRIQPIVGDAAKSLRLSGIVATEGGCPPFKGKVFKGSGAEVFSGCERYSNFVFDHFVKTPSINLVVIAGDWQRYDQSYEGNVVREIAQILASRGGRLIFVSAIPSPHADVPHEWARKQFQAGRAIPEWTTPRVTEATIFDGGMKIGSMAAAQTKTVTIVDPFEPLCSQTECFIVKDDRALYMDTDHLSDLGVEYLAASIRAALASAAGEIATRDPNVNAQR